MFRAGGNMYTYILVISRHTRADCMYIHFNVRCFYSFVTFVSSFATMSIDKTTRRKAYYQEMRYKSLYNVKVWRQQNGKIECYTTIIAIVLKKLNEYYQKRRFVFLALICTHFHLYGNLTGCFLHNLRSKRNISKKYGKY